MIGFVPEAGKVLPPPNILNATSVYCGMAGLFSSTILNAFHRRPPFFAGIHRHALAVTIGYCFGYQLQRHHQYRTAKRDTNINEYLQYHPELVIKETRTFAEYIEPFIPVR